MMKYFRWDFLKKHVGITHLIAFSLGVIVICFLDALVFEKSIADWVSSTANVVMAGAALYAAWNAKDWLSSSLRNKGFDLAVKLRNEIPNMLKGIVNNNNIDMIKLDEFTDHIDSKISHAKKIKIDNFAINLLPKKREKNEFCKINVDNVIQSMDSSIKTLEDTLKELEVFGWILKDDNKFHDLIEKLKERMLKLRNQDNTLDELINFIKNSENNHEVRVFISEYESIKKNISDLKTSVSQDRNDLIECIDKCFNYKSIQDPFNFK